jgi:hypothetical protein
MNRKQVKVCTCSFLCIFMQPYIFSFSLGSDKGGQSDGYQGRQCVSGGINRAWAEMRHSSGVGGFEVQATRWVHWGVER